ncbi:response regulator transcription factor [Parasphingorhabdus sp.]|uniref:response regulator transcription factor n=1 Tax=Parasphingorhabdus sp. TaxID=2709688 RepID=UPI003A9355EC
MARIIYAEDDELMGEIVRDTLMDAGHAVGVIGDGVTALQVAKMKNPDLIILDCSMPKMGGVEVLRRIRANHELYSTPVLMLTGRSSATDQQIAFDAGATEYLRKPFNRERLVFIVENMLEEFQRRYGARPQARRSL